MEFRQYLPETSHGEAARTLYDPESSRGSPKHVFHQHIVMNAKGGTHASDSSQLSAVSSIAITFRVL